MKEKRSRARIKFDIVSLALRKGGAAIISRIEQGANLPHDRASAYVSELVADGLLEKKESGGKTAYAVTGKGARFHKEFRFAEKVSDAFGIRI
jgi:predicted transcriptional regulator